jgi:hypothetical protein
MLTRGTPDETGSDVESKSQFDRHQVFKVGPVVSASWITDERFD